jgi:hypothetical protein
MNILVAVLGWIIVVEGLLGIARPHLLLTAVLRCISCVFRFVQKEDGMTEMLPIAPVESVAYLNLGERT